MLSYYEIKKAQEKTDPFEQAKRPASKNNENREANQNLERATRKMTVQEQKKLVTLFDSLEKELHFILIDIMASMCRLTDEEQKIVDSIVPRD